MVLMHLSPKTETGRPRRSGWIRTTLRPSLRAACLRRLIDLSQKSFPAIVRGKVKRRWNSQSCFLCQIRDKGFSLTWAPMDCMPLSEFQIRRKLGKARPHEHISGHDNWFFAMRRLSTCWLYFCFCQFVCTNEFTGSQYYAPRKLRPSRS